MLLALKNQKYPVSPVKDTADAWPFWFAVGTRHLTSARKRPPFKQSAVGPGVHGDAVNPAYVNPFPSVPVPAPAVTATSTVPGACVGAFAEIAVASSTRTSEAGTPSNVTDAPSAKLAPAMITVVPPGGPS